MSSIIDQIRLRIQDPERITTMNQFLPGQQKIYPPTSNFVVEATEKELSFKLPPLLAQLYTQVANGGFGPGYGIYGLEGGYGDPIPVPQEDVNTAKRGTLIDWYFC